MKNLQRTEVPAFFELTLTSDGSLLMISVHRMLLDFLCGLSLGPRTPMVEHYLSKFRHLGEFSPPNASGWGFSKALKESGNWGGWTIWACPFPLMRGEGSNVGPYSPAVMQLRTSLAVFFTAASLFEDDTGHSKPQLMVPEMLVEVDMHGGRIQVLLTPAVARWLSRCPDNLELVPVVNAMKAAHQLMWPEKIDGSFAHRFSARCRAPKWINLSIPGNACGLDPSDYYDEDVAQGYKLSPHNVDSSMQQLTFLAGLARLHDLVRGTA